MHVSSSKTSMRFYRLAFKLLKHSSRLSHKNMMRIGRFIGRRIMQLDSSHSRIAAINLTTCLPLQSPQQQRELIQQHFENLGMGIMEMALSWWASDEKFNALVNIKGISHLKQAQQQGRGIILVTGSFTTPEVLLRFVGQQVKTTSFYQPHHNEFIDACIQAYRKKHSHEVLTHENITAITTALSQNAAILLTHDAETNHKQIVFADFFGTPAATNTAAHRFARMTGAAVIPVHAIRKSDDMGYEILFEAPLADFPSDAQRDCQRLNQTIERWIDKNPQQYDWSFARFRQRPDGEAVFY